MHRKTRLIPVLAAVLRVIRFVTCLALAIAIVATLVMLLSSQPAGAASAASATAPWMPGGADDQTCHGLFSYLRHPAGQRFARMYRESRQADTYLRTDVALWNADRDHRKPRWVLNLDRGFTYLDCTTTGD